MGLQHLCAEQTRSPGRTVTCLHLFVWQGQGMEGAKVVRKE